MEPSRGRIKMIAFVAAWAFLGFMAILLHLEYLHLMAAAMILLPFVSALLGRLLFGGLACERLLPGSCTLGERVDVTLVISNTGPLPKFFLRVRDGLPRWARLVPAGPSALVQLLPGEAGEVTYQMEPQKRGVYVLRAAEILGTDPLGIWSYARPLPCLSELVVYPTVLPLRRVFWEDAGGQGLESFLGGSQRGEGLDFHSVREYRPGDELRRVHWRTTARVGTLAVMEYEQGQSSEIVLALDLSRDAYEGTGDGPDSALECAVTIAASVVNHLLRRGHRVVLLLPERGDGELRLGGPGDVPRLLDALARVQADALQTLPDLLQSAPRTSGDAASLVFVTPRPPDSSLAAALSRWHDRGVSAAGFVLDGGTFRPGPRGNTVSDVAGTLPEVPVRIIRRGDDLRHVLEGGHVR